MTTTAPRPESIFDHMQAQPDHLIRYSLKRKLWVCLDCDFEYASYNSPRVRLTGRFTQRELDAGCDRFHQGR